MYTLPEDTRAESDSEDRSQSAPMPSAEQQPAKSDSAGSAVPQEASDQVQEDGATTTETQVQSDTDDLELPEGVTERTREQFNKLKGMLREEREQREKRENVFESIKPKGQEPKMQTSGAMSDGQIQDVISQFIDPDTGVVDVNGLNRVIAQTAARSARAEQVVRSFTAQQRQMEEERQAQEAFEAYPNLDPKSDGFDETLHRKTRAFLVDSMLKPGDYGNKTLTYREAADLAHEGIEKAVEDAKKEGAKEALEDLTPKEQAALEAQGRSDKRTAGASLEELRKRSRRGDKDAELAIIERLKKIPPEKP